jgi:pimeloyl-ACP methyl ester carboxylesterase
MGGRSVKRRLILWCVVALLTLLAIPPLAQAKGGAKAPPAPTLVGGEAGDIAIMGTSGSCGTPGTWYVGATPPNADYSKPVLLFVHGKGSCAQTWWGQTTYHGTNDMYTYAYNNGYRTAFVDLYGDKTMWDNGSLLNGLIDTIRGYFGVSKLTIVAHSKGGVDSNAALVHFGAADAGAGGAHRASVAVGARSGIYNASVTVTGTLADGTAFERSLAGSFAAVAPAERGTWR